MIVSSCGEIFFDSKYLSITFVPNLSGRVSWKTPANPSKYLSSVLVYTLFNESGNLIGEISKLLPWNSLSYSKYTIPSLSSIVPIFLPKINA